MQNTVDTRSQQVQQTRVDSKAKKNSAETTQSQSKAPILNRPATTQYLNIVAHEQEELGDVLSRSYNRLNQSLSQTAADPEGQAVDEQAEKMATYTKLAVKVISRDPNLQEQVAQDLSTGKKLVRSRNAADNLQEAMSNLPQPLKEGTAAGKQLAKFIVENLVSLTDSHNMGAGLERDLAVRQISVPKQPANLRTQQATSKVLSASIAYVQSNQPEVLATLESDEPEVVKPGTTTAQIMTRYLRQALNEFPEDSTYLDIFKQNRGHQKSEGYADKMSEEIAQRIHSLISKAANTAKSGNLINLSPEEAARFDQIQREAAGQGLNNKAQANLAQEALPKEQSNLASDKSAPNTTNVRELSLSELSARAAKLQQQFRQERQRLANDGKLPDPAPMPSRSFDNVKTARDILKGTLSPENFALTEKQNASNQNLNAAVLASKVNAEATAAAQEQSSQAASKLVQTLASPNTQEHKIANSIAQDQAQAIPSDNAKATDNAKAGLGDSSKSVQGEQAKAAQGDSSKAIQGDAKSAPGDSNKLVQGDSAKSTLADTTKATDNAKVADNAKSVQGDASKAVQGDSSKSVQADSAKSTQGQANQVASDGDESVAAQLKQLQNAPIKEVSLAEGTLQAQRASFQMEFSAIQNNMYGDLDIMPGMTIPVSHFGELSQDTLQPNKQALDSLKIQARMLEESLRQQAAMPLVEDETPELSNNFTAPLSELEQAVSGQKAQPESNKSQLQLQQFLQQAANLIQQHAQDTGEPLTMEQSQLQQFLQQAQAVLQKLDPKLGMAQQAEDNVLKASAEQANATQDKAVSTQDKANVSQDKSAVATQDKSAVATQDKSAVATQDKSNAGQDKAVLNQDKSATTQDKTLAAQDKNSATKAPDHVASSKSAHEQAISTQDKGQGHSTTSSDKSALSKSAESAPLVNKEGPITNKASLLDSVKRAQDSLSALVKAQDGQIFPSQKQLQEQMSSLQSSLQDKGTVSTDSLAKLQNVLTSQIKSQGDLATPVQAQLQQQLQQAQDELQQQATTAVKSTPVTQEQASLNNTVAQQLAEIVSKAQGNLEQQAKAQGEILFPSQQALKEQLTKVQTALDKGTLTQDALSALQKALTEQVKTQGEQTTPLQTKLANVLKDAQANLSQPGAERVINQGTEGGKSATATSTQPTDPTSKTSDTKSSVLEQNLAKPADASAKPSDASGKSTDTSSKPSVLEQTQAKPADTASTKPSDVATKPSETAQSTAKPIDAAAKPTDTSSKPTETHANKVVDASLKSAESMTNKAPDSVSHKTVADLQQALSTSLKDLGKVVSQMQENLTQLAKSQGDFLLPSQVAVKEQLGQVQAALEQGKVSSEVLGNLRQALAEQISSQGGQSTPLQDKLLNLVTQSQQATNALQEAQEQLKQQEAMAAHTKSSLVTSNSPSETALPLFKALSTALQQMQDNLAQLAKAQGDMLFTQQQAVKEQVSAVQQALAQGQVDTKVLTNLQQALTEQIKAQSGNSTPLQAKLLDLVNTAQESVTKAPTAQVASAQVANANQESALNELNLLQSKLGEAITQAQDKLALQAKAQENVLFPTQSALQEQLSAVQGALAQGSLSHDKLSSLHTALTEQIKFQGNQATPLQTKLLNLVEQVQSTIAPQAVTNQADETASQTNTATLATNTAQTSQASPALAKQYVDTERLMHALEQAQKNIQQQIRAQSGQATEQQLILATTIDKSRQALEQNLPASQLHTLLQQTQGALVEQTRLQGNLQTPAQAQLQKVLSQSLASLQNALTDETVANTQPASQTTHQVSAPNSSQGGVGSAISATAGQASSALTTAHNPLLSNAQGVISLLQSFNEDLVTTQQALKVLQEAPSMPQKQAAFDQIQQALTAAHTKVTSQNFATLPNIAQIQQLVGFSELSVINIARANTPERTLQAMQQLNLCLTQAQREVQGALDIVARLHQANSGSAPANAQVAPAQGTIAGQAQGTIAGQHTQGQAQGQAQTILGTQTNIPGTQTNIPGTQVNIPGQAQGTIAGQPTQGQGQGQAQGQAQAILGTQTNIPGTQVNIPGQAQGANTAPASSPIANAPSATQIAAAANQVVEGATTEEAELAAKFNQLRPSANESAPQQVANGHITAAANLGTALRTDYSNLPAGLPNEQVYANPHQAVSHGLSAQGLDWLMHAAQRSGLNQDQYTKALVQAQITTEQFRPAPSESDTTNKPHSEFTNYRYASQLYRVHNNPESIAQTGILGKGQAENASANNMVSGSSIAQAFTGEEKTAEGVSKENSVFATRTSLSAESERLAARQAQREATGSAQQVQAQHAQVRETREQNLEAHQVRQEQQQQQQQAIVQQQQAEAVVKQEQVRQDNLQQQQQQAAVAQGQKLGINADPELVDQQFARLYQQQKADQQYYQQQQQAGLAQQIRAGGASVTTPHAQVLAQGAVSAEAVQLAHNQALGAHGTGGASQATAEAQAQALAQGVQTIGRTNIVDADSLAQQQGRNQATVGNTNVESRNPITMGQGTTVAHQATATQGTVAQGQASLTAQAQNLTQNAQGQSLAQGTASQNVAQGMTSPNAAQANPNALAANMAKDGATNAQNLAQAQANRQVGTVQGTASLVPTGDGRNALSVASLNNSMPFGVTTPNSSTQMTIHLDDVNLDDPIVKNMGSTVPAQDEGNMNTNALTGVVADTEIQDGDEFSNVLRDNLSRQAQGGVAGAAAVTLGENAPLPAESVVASANAPREGGFLHRLASLFGGKTQDENGEEVNIQSQAEKKAQTSPEMLKALQEQALQSQLKQSSLDHMMQRLQHSVADQSLPPQIREQAQKLMQALENPVADLHTVSSWLNFITGPMSPSSSQALAMHQWAFMLLCIRFEQIGKDIEKFLRKRMSGADIKELEPNLHKAQHDSSVFNDLVDEPQDKAQQLLEDTFSQVSRLQQQVDILPTGQLLPHHIPLPPLYRGGKEGSLHAQQQTDEDGGKSWHLNFNLDLEKLGQMQVKVKLRFPDIQMSFVTSNLETLQAVQAHMPELNARLKEIGLTSKGSSARLGRLYTPTNNEQGSTTRNTFADNEFNTKA